MQDFITKKCRRCGEAKPLAAFVLDKRAKDGRGGRCKTCHSSVAAESFARRTQKPYLPFVAKACVTCGVVQGADGYIPRPGMRDGYRNECRKCMSARAVSNRQRIEAQMSPSRLAERRRAYRLINVSTTARASRKQALKRYGMTIESFELLLKAQDDKCAICLMHLNSPQIDHCHQSGKVRGILCRRCNMGLGLFRDDQSALERAIRYLAP